LDALPLLGAPEREQHGLLRVVQKYDRAHGCGQGLRCRPDGHSTTALSDGLNYIPGAGYLGCLVWSCSLAGHTGHLVPVCILHDLVEELKRGAGPRGLRAR
jgi:hypothetical protein